MSQKRPLIDLDPDYEGISFQQKKRQKIIQEDAKEATVVKIEEIINKQFSVEVRNKEKEIKMIDMRLEEARCMLDQLRACVISAFYSHAQHTHVQSKAASTATSGIHPSVKKFLGKSVSEAHSLSPWTTACNSATAQEQPRVAMSTKKEEVAKNEARPRLEKTDAPLTHSHWSDVKGNWNSDHGNRSSRFKTKKRIVIGNVSKYLPSEGRDENDPATHKWMIYVRGPRDKPVIDHFVHKVWFFLHPSYKPHDLVEITASPFHLTRRGWGEFPVRVQLHFKDSRNKRVDVIHHLKLDQTYTGLQTLGSETVIDVELEKDSFDPFTKTYSFPELMRQPESTVTVPTISSLHDINTDSEECFGKSAPVRLIGQSDNTKPDLTPSSPGPESVDSGIACDKSTNWTHLQIKCESDSLSSIASESQSCRSSTPALTSPTAANRSRRDSQRSADDPGWMHVQIKSEPTTPDRPSSSCSGWTDITHFSTPDRNESHGSVPSSPVSCFSSDSVSRASANLRSGAPSPNLKMTVQGDRAKAPPSSPCKPATCFQFGGSLGSTKPINTTDSENLTEGKDSEMSVNSKNKVNTENNNEKDLWKVSSPKSSASASQSGNLPNQRAYIKCVDASGKVLLVPQHLLLERSTVQSPPASLSAVSTATTCTSSSSKPSSTVVGSGLNQATLTYILNTGASNRLTGNILQSQSASSQSNTLAVTNGVTKTKSLAMNNNTAMTLTNSTTAAANKAFSQPLVSQKLVSPAAASNSKLSMTSVQLPSRSSLSINSSDAPPVSTVASGGQHQQTPLLIHTADGKLQILQALPSLVNPSKVSVQPGVKSVLKPASIVAQTPRLPGSHGVTTTTTTVMMNTANVKNVAASGNSFVFSSPAASSTRASACSPVRMGTSKQTVNQKSSPINTSQTLALHAGKQLIIVGDGYKSQRHRAPSPLTQHTKSVPALSHGGAISLLRPVVPTPSNNTVRAGVPGRSSGLAARGEAEKNSQSLGGNGLKVKLCVSEAAKTAGSLVVRPAVHTTQAGTQAASLSVTSSTSLPSSQPLTSLLKPLPQLTSSSPSTPPHLLTTKIGNKTVILKLDSTTPVSSSKSAAHSVSSVPMETDVVKSEPEDLKSSDMEAKDSITKHLMFKSIRSGKLSSEPKEPKLIFGLCDVTSVESLVSKLVKHYPLVHPNPDKSVHPYCAQSDEEFCGWNVGKRRAAEWHRACMVRRKMLQLLAGSYTFADQSVWTRRHIVTWCRHHGYTPTDPELARRFVSSEEDTPAPATLSSALGLIDSLHQRHLLVKKESQQDEDEEVDVTSCETRVSNIKVKKEEADIDVGERIITPVDETAIAVAELVSRVGISLEPVALDTDEITNVPLCVSVVEKMITAVTKSFTEDLIRKSLCRGYGLKRLNEEITVNDVCQAISSLPRLDFLTNQHLGAVLEGRIASVPHTTY